MQIVPNSGKFFNAGFWRALSELSPNLGKINQKISVILLLRLISCHPRKLWVSETQQALMHKSSVNCTNGNYIFPSPYFAYGEKIKTKVIAAKTTTMVSPLHLILFGSSSVVYHGDRVLVDEWCAFASCLFLFLIGDFCDKLDELVVK